MKIKSKLASVAAAASALSLAGGLAATAAPAGASVRPHVLTAGVINQTEGKFGQVLADRSRFTLYLLTDELGTKFHCTSANGCWSFWKPLLVTKGQKVSIGAGVKGKVTLVSVNKADDQVVFNSYPVYTFVGDSKPAEQHGLGLKSYGGTWYMLRATATTPSTTPVK